MTYFTQRILEKPILRSRFLSLGLISLVLIALQATPAIAQWTANGDNVYKTTTSGNVGIGTTSPTAVLTVGDSTSPTGITLGPALFSQNTGGATQSVVVRKSFTGASGPSFVFAKSRGSAALPSIVLQGDFVTVLSGYGYDGTTYIPTASISMFVDGTPGTNDMPGGITFSTTEDGAAAMTERMRITNSGNVGIGTSSPSASYKLDVNGGINASGNINATGTITGGTINAKYQDVAEWVPTSEQIPPGTVVVLDATKSNHVIASTKGYDTRVAGVISEQPGITLGERGDNKVLVATTGRVRIKVDASRSPIQVGDLLVTSDVPGLAMKSEPVNIGGVQLHRPGTLIGKALEPLEKGSGKILVLLSLQ